MNSIKFRKTQIHFFIDSFLTCHHRRGCSTLQTLSDQNLNSHYAPIHFPQK